MADTDIFRNYNFIVNMVPGGDAYFTEVEGLSIAVSKIAYREGGSAGGGVAPVRKLPGQVEYGDVTLRWGLTADRAIWDWLMKTVEGNVERRLVSIIMRPPNGGPEQTRWNLDKAWPCLWRGAKLDGLAQGVAIETLVLAHEGLTRL